MDAAPQAVGDFLKEQTWFFGLYWGHAEVRIFSHTQRCHGWKPNCAVSKVRCLQSARPPWPLSRFVAHASVKGTSSSDSWTVAVLMYVLPYLRSHLDSATLLMPNTPKQYCQLLTKGTHKSGFSENTISFFILPDFVCSPSSNSMQLQNDFAPGLSPNQRHKFTFFHQGNITRRGLLANRVLYCPRQAERVDRDPT